MIVGMSLEGLELAEPVVEEAEEEVGESRTVLQARARKEGTVACPHCWRTSQTRWIRYPRALSKAGDWALQHQNCRPGEHQNCELVAAAAAVGAAVGAAAAEWAPGVVVEVDSGAEVGVEGEVQTCPGRGSL